MITLQQIPEGSVEIQTGLYLYEYNLVIGGTTYLRRELYSSEGYCFYDSEEEIYDEEGNLLDQEDILPTQRTYAQYASLGIAASYWSLDQLNAKYISVPVQEGFEIVSVGTQTETI